MLVSQALWRRRARPTPLGSWRPPVQRSLRWRGKPIAARCRPTQANLQAQRRCAAFHQRVEPLQPEGWRLYCHAPASRPARPAVLVVVRDRLVGVTAASAPARPNVTRSPGLVGQQLQDGTKSRACPGIWKATRAGPPISLKGSSGGLAGVLDPVQQSHHCSTSQRCCSTFASPVILFRSHQTADISQPSCPSWTALGGVVGRGRWSRERRGPAPGQTRNR